MASTETLLEVSRARKDLEVVASSPNLNRIRGFPELFGAWEAARRIALNWLAKVEPRLATADDDAVKIIIRFATQLVDIAEGTGVRPNEDFLSAVRRAKNEFQVGVPFLAYELLESSGLFQFSDNALSNWREATRNEIDQVVAEATSSILKTVQKADENLRASAVEAGKEFELAKARSQRITVDNAETQFELADKGCGSIGLFGPH